MKAVLCFCVMISAVGISANSPWPVPATKYYRTMVSSLPYLQNHHTIYRRDTNEPSKPSVAEMTEWLQKIKVVFLPFQSGIDCAETQATYGTCDLNEVDTINVVHALSSECVLFKVMCPKPNKAFGDFIKLQGAKIFGGLAIPKRILQNGLNQNVSTLVCPPEMGFTSLKISKRELQPAKDLTIPKWALQKPSCQKESVQPPTNETVDASSPTTRALEDVPKVLTSSTTTTTTKAPLVLRAEVTVSTTTTEDPVVFEPEAEVTCEREDVAEFSQLPCLALHIFYWCLIVLTNLATICFFKRRTIRKRLRRACNRADSDDEGETYHRSTPVSSWESTRYGQQESNNNTHMSSSSSNNNPYLDSKSRPSHAGKSKSSLQPSKSKPVEQQVRYGSSWRQPPPQHELQNLKAQLASYDGRYEMKRPLPPQKPVRSQSMKPAPGANIYENCQNTKKSRESLRRSESLNAALPAVPKAYYALTPAIDEEPMSPDGDGDATYEDFDYDPSFNSPVYNNMQ